MKKRYRLNKKKFVNFLGWCALTVITIGFEVYFGMCLFTPELW